MSPNYKRAQSEWFDQLRSQGHDAWLPESNPDLAVILRDPEQIKSAISNTGEFSGPRIDRAEGGRLLEDEYPTQYLPNVGRQVMADGGEPTAQSRRRATLEQLGAFEDRPVMDPATMGENWASAVRRFRERPLREGEATVRPLELGGRDVIGGAIAGDGGIVRSRIADIVAGSRGLPGSGTLGMGVADLTPAGIPLAVSDFSDALRNEDYLSAGLSAGLPAAYYARKPIMAAGRAAYDAGRRAVDVAGDVLGRVPAPVAAGGAGAAVMMPEEAEAARARAIAQAIASARAKERAKELGYDTSKVWYHSSLQPLESFQPTGRFMGRSGVSGIHLTDNPAMANRFLERFGDFDYKGNPFSKNVIPVFVKTGSVLEQDEPLKSGLSMGSPLPENYKNPLPKMGYDALLRNEAISSRGSVRHVFPGSRGAIEGKELVLTDPSQIRSIYDEYANGGSVSHYAMMLAREINSSPREETVP
jgi:hypothetical protein